MTHTNNLYIQIKRYRSIRSDIQPKIIPKHLWLIAQGLGITWFYSKRVAGIEPALLAWKAKVLPLNYTRKVLGRCDRLTLNITQTRITQLFAIAQHFPPFLLHSWDFLVLGLTMNVRTVSSTPLS